jgi:hypothetical protein
MGACFIPRRVGPTGLLERVFTVLGDSLQFALKN